MVRRMCVSVLKGLKALGDFFLGTNIPAEDFPQLTLDPYDPDRIVEVNDGV